MFSKLYRSAICAAATMRKFASTNTNFKQYKVAIIGAAGGTGHNLALLLKTNELIYKLSLYDVAEQIKGLGMDISHIPTNAISKGYRKERLVESLECCDVVVITTGGKRKPNMRREDHWSHNALITSEMARAAAKICPECFVAVISNPINSVVPLVCEIFKQECAFNPNHIFGLTNIDTDRSKVFVGDILGVNPESVYVPIVGGQSIASIIPVFSQCTPKLNLTDDQLKELVQKVQLATETVVRTKNNNTPSLSMAHCAYEFINSLLRALNCEPNIKQVGYVYCNALNTKYCCSEFIMGGDGIAKFCPQPKLNQYEEQLLQMGIPDIKKHVKRAEEYAATINPYKKPVAKQELLE